MKTKERERAAGAAARARASGVANILSSMEQRCDRIGSELQPALREAVRAAMLADPTSPVAFVADFLARQSGLHDAEVAELTCATGEDCGAGKWQVAGDRFAPAGADAGRGRNA